MEPEGNKDHQPATPPVLRGSVSSQDPVAATGVTAADYRRAKTCAILLPIVIVVGTAGAYFIMLGGLDDEVGWRKSAQRIIIFATVLVTGLLASRATQLKMEPFRAYKREVDLAEYRRRKGL